MNSPASITSLTPGNLARWCVFSTFCLLCGNLPAATTTVAESNDKVTVQHDVSYLPVAPADDYSKKQCLLDVYLPKNADKPFPLVVWFHGGALRGGAKNSAVSVQVAMSLAARGVGVILAEYRMSPHVKFPVYIQDSAQAVKWAVDHAAELHAQPKIFVGGHSAGGYISSLLAMDRHYLVDAGIKKEQIAGFISMSGQMMTHFTVGEENKISSSVITADDAAPVHFVRPDDIPPFLVLIGDHDWPARLEENQYFIARLRNVATDPSISMFMIAGRDHGGILKHTAEDNDPAATYILDFMKTGVLPPEPNVVTYGHAPEGKAE